MSSHATDPLTVRKLEPWLGREMASPDLVERIRPGRVLFREDPHPSEILRTRSETCHRVGELYEDMLRKDLDLAAIVRKRIDALMALPRRIVPADSSPEARDVADFCHRALGSVPNLSQNLRHQLMSVPMGIAFEELIWERLARGPLAGAWVPVQMIDRPMWRFAFREGVLYVRRARSLEPVAAPPGKFVVMRQETKDSPWGRALLDDVYWYWYIKKHGWKFYAVFIEKWASPTAQGKYKHRSGGEEAERANQDAQTKLLSALEAIQTHFAVVIPDSLEIELLEATRSGSISYESFILLLTRGMALAFLGEINTSGLRPGTGAFASERVSNDIRKEKVVRDAQDLSSHLTDNLLRLLVDVNFGVEAPCPRWDIDVIETEDREERRKGIDMVLGQGLPVPQRYFYLTAQVPEPTDGEDIVRQRPALRPQPGPPQPPAPTGGGLRHDRLPVAQTELDLDEEIALSEVRDEALTEVAQAFASHTLAYFEGHRALLLEAWDQGRVQEGDALRWVAERADSLAHAERLEAAGIHGLGLGLSQLLEDGVEERFWTSSGQPTGGLLDFAIAGRSTRPRLQAPPGFEQQTTPATAIDWWARLLSISKELFLELQDVLRRFVFTAAGILESGLLVEVQELLRQAVAEGWTRERFRAEMEAAYQRHGVEPTSDWHADLILNNILRQANAWLRYTQLVQNPAARRLIPYVGWATLGDDKVRARPLHNHLVMHRRIFAIGHEIWRTWWYPAGHNCRCYAFTVNRPRAERLGLVGAEPTGPWPSAPEGGLALPDPGFRGSPDLGAITATELEPTLGELFRSARGAPDLEGALITLLTRLLGTDPRQLFGFFARSSGGR